MPVLGVVPREELAAEVLCLLDVAEAAGEARVVLDRLELRLRVRVVVRDPGTAQRLRDAQVGQQLRRALARHGRSPVRVKREHPGLELRRYARRSDDGLGLGATVPYRA